MEDKAVFGLIARYLVLLVLGSFNLWVFYSLFGPLTVYPSYWLLSLFYKDVVLMAGNMIFLSGIFIEIIDACIAGAAYYLLLILNLSSPMKIIKRIQSIMFITLMFLFFNVLRIILFSALAVAGYAYFDATHKIVWYLGSTILVVVIWFLNVWLLDIKSVPIYTDFANVYKEIKKRKKEN